VFTLVAVLTLTPGIGANAATRYRGARRRYRAPVLGRTGGVVHTREATQVDPMVALREF